MYACLGVSCHLHFWQNDRGLLRATAVILECNGHRIRVCTHTLNPGEENSPATPARVQTRNLSITSPALYQHAIQNTARHSTCRFFFFFNFFLSCAFKHVETAEISVIIINPLTARVVGAPQMISQPIFVYFPCSPLPSRTCRTRGLPIP